MVGSTRRRNGEEESADPKQPQVNRLDEDLETDDEQAGGEPDHDSQDQEEVALAECEPLDQARQHAPHARCGPIELWRRRILCRSLDGGGTK